MVACNDTCNYHHCVLGVSFYANDVLRCSLYRNYWVQYGLVTGGQYNSHQGCEPYEIAACDHHVVGKLKPCSKSIEPTPPCTRKCEPGKYCNVAVSLYTFTHCFSFTSIGIFV